MKEYTINMDFATLLYPNQMKDFRNIIPKKVLRKLKYNKLFEDDPEFKQREIKV